jgi:hypothetical protein
MNAYLRRGFVRRTKTVSAYFKAAGGRHDMALILDELKQLLANPFANSQRVVMILVFFQDLGKCF